MKRILTLLLIASLMASSGAEALRSTPGEFEIKAYKIGTSDKGFVEFNVVDALTGSLKEIITALDIDGYYSLSSVDSAVSDNVDNVAFSYRVSGNVQGSFKVAITVEPFVQQVEEGSSPAVIKTRYFLVNETLRFIKSNTEKSDDGLTINDIPYVDDSGNPIKTDSDVLESETQDKILEDGFKVSGAGISSDTWVARGAVAFAIDATSYKSSPDGEYRAYITVNLTSDAEVGQ